MKLLKKLLDKGYEVVCFITYDFTRKDRDDPDYKPLMVTDVCVARLLDVGGKYERYSLACRGTGFIDYWTKGMSYGYSFEELLEARDIEFIEPTAPIDENTSR